MANGTKLGEVRDAASGGDVGEGGLEVEVGDGVEAEGDEGGESPEAAAGEPVDALVGGEEVEVLEGDGEGAEGAEELLHADGADEGGEDHGCEDEGGEEGFAGEVVAGGDQGEREGDEVAEEGDGQAEGEGGEELGTEGSVGEDAAEPVERGAAFVEEGGGDLLDEWVDHEQSEDGQQQQQKSVVAELAESKFGHERNCIKFQVASCESWGMGNGCGHFLWPIRRLPRKIRAATVRERPILSGIFYLIVVGDWIGRVTGVQG